MGSTCIVRWYPKWLLVLLVLKVHKADIDCNRFKALIADRPIASYVLRMSLDCYAQQVWKPVGENRERWQMTTQTTTTTTQTTTTTTATTTTIQTTTSTTIDVKKRRISGTKSERKRRDRYFSNVISIRDKDGGRRLFVRNKPAAESGHAQARWSSWQRRKSLYEPFYELLEPFTYECPLNIL